MSAERDLEIYKDALKIAISLINGLVDQQAMEDDWYWTDLCYLRVLSGESPSEVLADYRQARS